ncbi:hypothetical protein [Bradyrhizobium sp. CCGB20]|uniref:hypothetical protein n=1 Tax=Bradyrhizobium sp. CCGB20 TaxID=2949633 RepID=UPI0020B336C7|nr:hypothetical protein [Bradyrhizobium sp. CCGB20]MCP3396921.1 hypothetical protein [Bradyrhizobium sp. CCGB20]
MPNLVIRREGHHFDEREEQDWNHNLLATLLDAYAPGSWFELAEPKDRKAFEVAEEHWPN